MAKLDLAFQLTANADGMAAGVAKADKQLSQVGASARSTSAEFRQAAKITQELRTPTEKYADTIALLDSYLKKGLLTQEVYGRAVAKADAELKAATSSMDKMASSASIAERVINGLSGAIGGIGDATKSVAEAGISVIAFGKDIVWTMAQWKVLSALRNPAGLKDFAVGAIKGAAAARTLILAAKALGVGLALSGGAAGTTAAAVLGLTNPLVGGALLALNLGRAFLNAKDRAMEMAAAITAGTVSLAALNGQLGKVQAQQVDNLAFAVEEMTAAGQRSEAAFSGFGDVFVTPFIGAFAAIQSGLAGLTDGISGVLEGITSIASPIAQAIAPIFTLAGTVVEGVLKLGGVLLDTVGIVLKLAGAFTRTLLSPVIVGLTNTVELIRSGMNSAFDFIGSKIDFVAQKIKDFYAFMSDVPVIGGAFASGETPTTPGAAMAAGAEQAAVDASASDALDATLEEFGQRRALEQQIEDARKKASQDELDATLKEFGERRALEQQIEDARKKASQDELDAKLKEFGERRALEQQIAEANRKQQEAVARKQEDIDAFNAERATALSGKSNESLKANDIRSSEGISQFLALASGREDPAIAEYRKQTAKLDELKAELRALQLQQVDILGAAA